jgi:hypothetical protein
MTALTMPFPSGRPTRGSGVLKFLSGLAAGVRDGLAVAARYDKLARLSDSDLARLGLQREDIPRVALGGGKR